MNQGYEQNDEQDSGFGFMTGLFAGVAIGVGLGLLFAPSKGAELRQGIADSAATAGKAVKDTYRQASDAATDTIDEISTRGRQAFDQARKVVSHARGELSRTADDALKTVEDAASSSREFVNKASADVRSRA